MAAGIFAAVRGAVLAYGADVVLAFLAAETALLLFGARRPIAARPGAAAERTLSPPG
jgi:hypothetical protein